MVRERTMGKEPTHVGHPPVSGHDVPDRRRWFPLWNQRPAASVCPVQAGPLIGVFPAAEHAARRQLFEALEASFAVRFVGRQFAAWAGLEGAIVFGSEEASSRPPVPSLVLAGAGGGAARTRQIELTSSDVLDQPLRGRRLDEHSSPEVPRLPLQAGATQLAMCDGSPVWVHCPGEPGRWMSALGPDELAPGEGLRDQLRPGRFMGLLPLVDFLRRLRPGESRGAGGLRACFVIDDPNLHAPRYGHIRYVDLRDHARRHGYHIAMASIPLDYWLVHRRTAELFRSGSRHLSLTVHGNNHERSELLQFASEADALAPAAQALRRVERLERRSSITVSRVMCAPHEECSPAMVRALFRVGFEALAFDPRRDPQHATRTGPFGGWEPAQLLGGGLPVLPRYGLPAGDELAFHAYLGLPLILYGHQQDLAGNLDVLADAAAQINALGDVQWLPLAQIARTNHTLTKDGARLTVRLYTRRTSVSVPEGIEELVVELPSSPTEADVLVRCGRQTVPVRLGPSGRARVSFPPPFEPSSELFVVAPDAVDASDVPGPGRRLQPVVRRILTEARDRLAPFGIPPVPERT